MFSFFFNHPATTQIYTLSLHDALPISCRRIRDWGAAHHRLDRRHPAEPREAGAAAGAVSARPLTARSEEHTSELQSLTNLVCRLLLEKKKKKKEHINFLITISCYVI